MSSDTRLHRFAAQYDGNLDALSLDVVEELNQQLVKRETLADRGLTTRADEVGAEVADAIGANFEPVEDSDTTTDTLSAADCRAALDRLLNTGLDVDALHARHRVEEHKQRLKKKQAACESRGMSNRAEEIAAEVTVLEAAHEETQQADGRYSESDVDTLADRVARDGYVLTTGPDGGLTARQTGGSE